MLKDDLDALLKPLSRRLHAQDGMALTGYVWNEAHAYEALARQLRWWQHPGILYGFEVVAHDPLNMHIVVKPGAAIDPEGRLIVQPEDRAVDLSKQAMHASWLRIFLRFDQSPVPGTDAPYTGLNVVHEVQKPAVFPSEGRPPDDCLELARIRWPSHSAGQMVGKRDIDLRFRRYVDEGGRPSLAAAVIGLGQNHEADAHLYGLQQLGRQINTFGRLALAADRLDTFSDALKDYDLVYVACGAGAIWEAAQIDLLRGFLEKGGTVWVEAPEGMADINFGEPSKKLSSLTNPDAHPLLRGPNLFAALPSGPDTSRLPVVKSSVGTAAVELQNVTQGELWCSTGYWRLWQADGGAGKPPPTREMVRAAQELGENLLILAAERRSLIGSPGERRRGL